MQNFLNTVNNLNPVEFSFRDSSNFNLRKRQSFIQSGSETQSNSKSLKNKSSENNFKGDENSKESSKSRSERIFKKKSSSLKREIENLINLLTKKLV